ncbi:hypothetical protein NOS3756_53520 [Nostoc sp. NIES-3756]|nr:hypothetical protein NOS3756_53520 [Nostoc sp. NIES-3756]BAY35881.1 hypothetical protein NIES2111_01990 [Nostoc sp. NIES-2111]
MYTVASLVSKRIGVKFERKKLHSTLISIKDSSTSIKDSFTNIKHSSANIKDSSTSIKNSFTSIKHSSANIKDSSTSIKHSSASKKDLSPSIKDSCASIKDSLQQFSFIYKTLSRSSLRLCVRQKIFSCCNYELRIILSRLALTLSASGDFNRCKISKAGCK